MAKQGPVLSLDLKRALTRMGIDIENTRRVVIDINAEQGVVVHIEQFGDERVIDVVRSLAGIDITRKDSTDG